MEENPLTTPQQTSAQQPKPPPKPPCLPRRSKPQKDTDPSIFTRTRSQQRTIDQNYNPLSPLPLEETKTRENNIAYMKHLREAMKNREMEPSNTKRKDLEMVLKAIDMSPVFIPSVKEEWVRAVQLKPSTHQEDPENLPKQPI